MRHNIIYLMTAILPLCGCTDWLMVQPRGVEVPSGIEHYEGLLYGTELVTIREVFPYMCFENTCSFFVEIMELYYIIITKTLQKY